MKRAFRLGDEAATRTMAVAGALLGLVIGGVLYLPREPALPTVQASLPPLPTTALPAAATSGVPTGALHAPPADQVVMAAREAPRALPHAATPPHDVPYRFLGRTDTGTDAAIVLFGRGRVVAVRRPGPLDEEYAVEHVADDQLLIRHLPSGAGRIVPLVLRGQAPDSSAQAQESPAD